MNIKVRHHCILTFCMSSQVVFKSAEGLVLCRHNKPVIHSETTWGDSASTSMEVGLLGSTCRCPFVDRKGVKTRRKGRQRPFNSPPHVPLSKVSRDPVYVVPLETPRTVCSRRGAVKRHADPFLRWQPYSNSGSSIRGTANTTLQYPSMPFFRRQDACRCPHYLPAFLQALLLRRSRLAISQ